MRFLVDAQLPPALARWLTGAGHDAQHVADLGLQASPDRVVWDHATAIGAVIVTKDEDFALRRTRVLVGPQVLWLRIGNCRTSDIEELIRANYRFIQQLIEDEERGILSLFGKDAAT